MRTCLAVSILLAALQDPKLPVPEGAEAKKSEAEIRGIFKDEFAKKDRESRRALGEKLLSQAPDASISPATRYTLLALARDVSGEALDFKTGFSAIEALERAYDLKPQAIAGATFASPLNLLKASYLAASRKHAPTADDLSLISGSLMALAEGAMAAGLVEDAVSFADQASKTGKDPTVMMRARQLTQEVAQLKGDRDAAVKAEAALAKNPDDAEANLAFGRFLLFVKKDENGLSYLSKGPPSPLRDAAAAELAKPATPEAMLAVAEAWLSIADKEKTGVAKARCQDRAIRWLEPALQAAGGLLRMKVKKRLSDLGRIEEPSTDQLLCRWFFDEGSGATTQDSGPKAMKGTLMNGAKWVSGPSGSAVSFDGVGSYVACEVANHLPFANIPQTVAWAHQAAANPKGTAFVVSLTSEKTPLILGLGYRDGKVSVWKTTATILQTPAPPAGEWHSYAYTYDQKSHKLYVDGELKGSSTESTMAGQYRMLELGRWYGGYPPPGGPPNQFFQGAVDDLRVYRRALSEEEIRELVRKKKP